VSAPIPAWVVTGPLGCGKTTLIAGLLAAKPADEHWAVLLNEFTDAGIDALTVAAAARGPYDVRLIPGGCLCCAGEADFRRTLQELVAGPRPARIIVEPSGIGHPAGIVEELLAHQAAGGIALEGVLGLVDPASIEGGSSTGGASIGDERGALAVATAEIADVLALAKADLATPAQVAAFEARAATLFPAKRGIGQVMQGRLPPELLEALSAGVSAAPLGGLADAARARPHAHAVERAHAAAHAAADVAGHGTGAVALPGAGERVGFSHLGRVGARWSFPPSVSFSEARVLAALGADTSGIAGLGRPERIKAVLRVDDDQWVLVQRTGNRVALAPSAWRRDNRIEVQLASGSEWEPRAWDAVWRGAMRGGARGADRGADRDAPQGTVADDTTR
jgi:G3E family GTPase